MALKNVKGIYKLKATEAKEKLSDDFGDLKILF
jgi:hypothetical protein